MKWKEALLAGPGPQNRKDALVLFAKGLCMGAADLIPGVSGGTIAFISGIYEELLEAIAAVNKGLLQKIFAGDFKAAFAQVHLRFLLPLLSGIMISILSLARLMHYLINDHPVLTWGAFFGLILASIFIIWRQLDRPWARGNICFIFLGTVFAYFMVSLIPVLTPENLGFIFFCGTISIIAMILPGLSGSFLLLILGKYEFVTGALRNPLAGEHFLMLSVFSTGALSGLLGFSKFLNFLMKKYHSATMAFLTGVLIGSMKKVWPWKEILETTMVRGKLRVLRDANIWPSHFEVETLYTLLLIAMGFAAVLWMDAQSKKNNKQKKKGQ